MQILRTLQFFSGRLPGDQLVTLHTGNERAFDDADAAYLLAEFPDRFAVSADAQAAAPDVAGLSADTPPQAVAPDESLKTKMVEVPPEVEQFGAEGARHAKAKKEKGAK